MEKQFLFVDVANPTWLVYLSVLVLAVFFRFSRLFTVRNLDLLLVLVLSASLVITGEWKGKPVVDPGTTERDLLTTLSISDEPAMSAGISRTVDDSRLPAPPVLTTEAQETSAPALTKNAEAVFASVERGPQPTFSSDSASAADSSVAAEPGVSAESTATARVLQDQTARRSSENSPNVEVLSSSPGESLPQNPDGPRPGLPSGSDEVAATTSIATPAAIEAPDLEVTRIDEPSSSQVTLQFHPVYRWGSITLLVLSVLLMVRLVFDESLTRRPRLEQNLNQAGLAFLCIPSFALLMVSVFVVEPPNSAMAAVEHGRALLERRETKVFHEPVESQPPAPTETLIAAGAAGVAQLSGQWESELPGGLHDGTDLEKSVAQILVVIAHTVVVLGLLHIGRQHFGSLQLGLSMSCLYLLLPCTAFNVHQLSHVLPGACLTWAIASYRKPVVSGVLLGLACGTLFFAVFLLPVWAVFYGRRGALRFGLSVFFVAAILAVCLMLTSSDADSFVSKLFTTMNWTVYRLLDETSRTPQTPFGQLFVRIPLAAVFFVMLTAMTVLPRPRNLENLLANSTALVVAAQLWYPEDIGTYVLWYLPLLLLIVFRPRLDRFMPPDLSDRASAAMSPPITSGAPSSVAMSRMTLYR